MLLRGYFYGFITVSALHSCGVYVAFVGMSWAALGASSAPPNLSVGCGQHVRENICGEGWCALDSSSQLTSCRVSHMIAKHNSDGTTNRARFRQGP